MIITISKTGGGETMVFYAVEYVEINEKTHTIEIAFEDERLEFDNGEFDFSITPDY